MQPVAFGEDECRTTESGLMNEAAGDEDLRTNMSLRKITQIFQVSGEVVEVQKNTGKDVRSLGAFSLNDLLENLYLLAVDKQQRI